MRVLMLSWEYPPHVVGGLGKHVGELVPALVRQGIEVHVVTPRRREGRETEVLEGLFVYRVTPPAGLFSDFVSEAQATNAVLAQVAQEVLARHRPFDLIHNHDWLTAESARELKLANKLPLVATIHATERGRGRGQLLGEQAAQINEAEWRLQYEAWRVIVCTEYMRREAQDYFGTPANKLDVIANGVDPRAFQALEGTDLSGFRLRFAQPDEEIVMYVGRIVAEKGIEVLIRSVPAVLAQCPKARFVIAGTGPELERMRRLATELDLAGQVLLPGFISDEDRDRLYKVADCAVFPSLYEPFGIVALEAMAAKAPVVVSEVGGLREVVRHAETGITVYPNEPASCAWGILHTLEHPEWARQRAANAYREVLTVYNWDNIAAQTRAVYERVVRERAATTW
ncbi:MAG: glycosyltransferase family 4 protein [Chloroflexota bacterium]